MIITELGAALRTETDPAARSHGIPLQHGHEQHHVQSSLYTPYQIGSLQQRHCMTGKCTIAKTTINHALGYSMVMSHCSMAINSIISSLACTSPHSNFPLCLQGRHRHGTWPDSPGTSIVDTVRNWSKCRWVHTHSIFAWGKHCIYACSRSSSS